MCSWVDCLVWKRRLMQSSTRERMPVAMTTLGGVNRVDIWMDIWIYGWMDREGE